jgi:exonuclease SbcC
MHVTRVELENIKTYETAVFTFSKGTTAITGLNGAGKTTILEAIAWALFDVLDYSKDDFLRRGAKKGAVRVTFESGVDGRTYTVYRDTANGYYIVDDALKMRLAEKKADVAARLRQHLGVEPGTDVKALFRSAIGVPQGAFTADFMQSAEVRKKAFDKLLKVEEYRESAERLRDTSKLVETRLNDARARIAKAEGQLEKYDSLIAERDAKRHETEQLTAALAALERDVAARSENVRRLDEAERQANDTRARAERLEVEHAAAQRLLADAARERDAARDARERQKTIEADHLAHLAAEEKLRHLDAQRTERDRLRDVQTQAVRQLDAARHEAARLAEAHAKAAQAAAQISELAPALDRQNELEKQRDQLRDTRARAQAEQRRHAQLKAELDKLREDFKPLNATIKQIEAIAPPAAQTALAATLAARESELNTQLARLRAEIERDEKFHREVQNGLCPILSARCLNIPEGTTLEKYLSGQFAANHAQLDAFARELAQVSNEARAARAAETESAKRYAELDMLKQRLAELTEEGQRKKAEFEGLEKSVSGLPQVESGIAATEAALQALNDPRATVAKLREEARQAEKLQTDAAHAQARVSELEKAAAAFDAKLARFNKLDDALHKARAESDRTRLAHQEFLRLEAAAATLEVRQQSVAQAENALAEAEKSLHAARAARETAAQNYRRVEHDAERAALTNARAQIAAANAQLQAAQNRVAELAAELLRLDEIRAQMREEFKAKDRLQQAHETTEFIRDTLKKAGPHVAQVYAYSISLEANQLYREITGEAHLTLRWTQDYEVLLEEEGYERSFNNLSGGEQMVAALSVRLALLKQLSDIRLAFFDEPTVNMDTERRTRLAQQIGQIQDFDQLFVISHDDSFAENVDNTVRVPADGSRGVRE